MKKNNLVVLSEIVVLIVSIVAFSYFVGQEFHVVSAAETCVRDMADNEVKTVDVIDEDTWCEQNGRDSNSYCNNIGSGVYKLKNTFTCSALTSIGSKIPPVPILRTTIDRRTKAAASSIPPTGIDTRTAAEKAAADEAAKKAAEANALKALEGNWAKLGGSILKNAATAALIYGGVKGGLKLIGVDSIGGVSSDTIATAAGAGYFAGSTAGSIYTFVTGAALSAAWTFGIGIGIAVTVMIFQGQEKQKVITFSCLPWEAPTGGANCEKCNTGEFPCTEYRCKSLGQQCELVNKGQAGELCSYVNRLDTNPPVIQPWLQVLTQGHVYSPDNAISPPDRGVKIVPTNNAAGCVAAFTPLMFGVTSNQPARCKVDANNTANFSEMAYFFGGDSRLKYNHSMQMSIPSKEALAAENITLENGGAMTIYVRCENAAGRRNVENFIFRFCVDQGPDRTPPNIVTTSILNGMPVAFGQESVPLQIFTNEPADCRWSRADKTYDDMAGDTQMTCDKRIVPFNDQQLYSCSTTLTGLRDLVDNDYFFKCLDQPHLDGTENAHQRNEGPSYKFTLKGTQSLVISSAGPNGTVIKDSTNVIKVTLNASTSAGFKDGEAICSFKNTATTDQPVEFFNTGTNKHSQDLYLPAASYNFAISCVDLGGNGDTKIISFKVETDTIAPTVSRVFRQENLLKVITNEEAQCVYSNFGCDYQFIDGKNMSKAVNGTEHSTAWDTNKIFYIKCSDRFGNQPFPNQCNIIAKPFELSKTK